ncbi:Putative major facilitator superfamily, MFS transporter superfamily [Septoria linicola]|uniref:Major facilitator superfamily, MFS transporter superfamily n=1 Tax=Septoria linicola TaxID=215465 RepID=A0A9Q9B8V4_9PEZI|nr:putative major facilitator superfamily, MFS transporter superfamily [Septoria linicola]USW59196.1 Putative major facilitator superfamily, MFS transporter superfamily [Septoria linicola]
MAFKTGSVAKERFRKPYLPFVEEPRRLADFTSLRERSSKCDFVMTDRNRIMGDLTIELTAIRGFQASEIDHSNLSITNNHETEEEELAHHNSQSLPPVDEGWQAWRFLAACFLLECIVWSLPFSFGIFQSYYQESPKFVSQSSSIASIGTTTIGVSYFSSPFLGIALQRFPRTRRPCMYLGLAIMALGLIGASFCDNITGLIGTQGVMYGFGSIMLYFPSNLFIQEWFVQRKGMAYGIMFAGTGFSGVGVPFVLQWLLHTYGFRTTFRVWAVVLVVLTLPILHFIRPRLPVTASSALRPQDLGFLKRKSFLLFQVGNILQSLGVFIPSLWMPTFALSLGFPSFAGPLSLAFYNGASSVGVIIGGHMSDRVHVSTVILTSTIGCMVASLVFWGLTSGQAMLYVFAILWGIFAGMYNATYSGCAKTMSRLEPNSALDTGIVIGIMAAGKGIGGVVSGPLSEKLLDVGWKSTAEFAYGTSYGVLVVFCGMSAAFGGTACVGRLLKML